MLTTGSQKCYLQLFCTVVTEHTQDAADVWLSLTFPQGKVFIQATATECAQNFAIVQPHALLLLNHILVINTSPSGC